MPRYHCLGTKVRLSVANLAATVTANPQQKKSATATGYVENAENILKNGRSLSEEHIPFTNEDGNEEEGYLHFLGRHKNMPFMMVHAGADLFKSVWGYDNGSRRMSGRKSLARASLDSSVSTLTSLPTTPRDAEVDEIEERIRDSQQEIRRASGPSTRNNPHPSNTSIAPSESSARHSVTPQLPLSVENLHRALNAPEVDMVPHALALQVFLSPKTFIRDFSEAPKAQDVKIDVFFNGLLANSYYISSRDRNNLQSKCHHQLFAGSRMHYLQERPWVILPPGQEADGSLRGLKRSKTAGIGPQERWEQIGAALLAEADKRGFNRYGDRPLTGEYLETLAQLNMPEAVDAMQRPGGPKFGVIDVIISVGEGKKHVGSANYLKEPTRLEDSRYKPLSEERRKINESVQDTIEQELLDATMMGHHGPTQGMRKSVSAPSLEAPKTVSTSESDLTRSSPRNNSSRTSLLSRTMPPPQTPASSFSTSPVKRRGNSSISVHGEAFAKRQRTSERIRNINMVISQSTRKATPPPGYGISRRGVFTHARSPSNIFPPKPVSDRIGAGQNAENIQIEGNPFAPRVKLPIASSTTAPSSTAMATFSRTTSVRPSVIVKRVVITANGKVIRDTTLSTPQGLAVKSPVRRSSRTARSETPGSVPYGESVPAAVRRKDSDILRDPATPPPSSSRMITAGRNNAPILFNFSGPEVVTAKPPSRLRLSGGTKTTETPTANPRTHNPPSGPPNPPNPFQPNRTTSNPAAPETPDPNPKRPRIASAAFPSPNLNPKPKPKPRRKPAPANPDADFSPSVPALSTPYAARHPTAPAKPPLTYPPFATPLLSQDCVITYARGGPWSAVGATAAGKAGTGKVGAGSAGEEVVRQVRCERPGVFREADIVCGVRFLVG